MTSTLRDVTPFLAAVGLFQPTNLRSCRCPNGSRAHRSGRTRAAGGRSLGGEGTTADGRINSRGRRRAHGLFVAFPTERDTLC